MDQLPILARLLAVLAVAVAPLPTGQCAAGDGSGGGPGMHHAMPHGGGMQHGAGGGCCEDHHHQARSGGGADITRCCGCHGLPSGSSWLPAATGRDTSRPLSPQPVVLFNPLSPAADAHALPPRGDGDRPPCKRPIESLLALHTLLTT